MSIINLPPLVIFPPDILAVPYSWTEEDTETSITINLLHNIIVTYETLHTPNVIYNHTGTVSLA